MLKAQGLWPTAEGARRKARCRGIVLALWVVCLGSWTLAEAVARARDENEAAGGMSWLHSFEYERALAAFERAEKADPRNPMAYWGQAMCYEQLLWGNENVDEARAILDRMRRSGALARATEQERDWLATLAVLFGPGDRVTRLDAYSEAMGKLEAKYPDDADVAAFRGLALLATRARGLAGAHPSTHRDEPLARRSPEGGGGQLAGSAEQEQAARIFGRILDAHPRHPGALHYLIHAWDDPANAHKALDAARVYAAVVPESSHARHMPAHVFVQLGMWNDAIASDEAAVAAADAKVTKDGLPVTATDFHPLSWLVYEYLQANRFADARRMLERLRAPAEATRDPRLLSMLATLRSRVAVEEEDWSAVPGPDFVNSDELFAVGYSAARRGDAGLAERARMRLAQLATEPRYAERRVLLDIMALQVGAAIRALHDDIEGALALSADATRRERALPPSIGPPPLIKPAQEQYGELLLGHGRPAEAAAQFAGALERARNRRLAVEGLARARTAATAGSSASRRGALAGGGGVVLLIILLVAARHRRTRPA